MYEAATKLPKKLACDIQKRHRLSENQLYFFSLLAQSPEVIEVGEWRRGDRKIHFPKAVTWNEISAIAVVTGLNFYLAEIESPYRLWYECRKGNPKVKKGERAKKYSTPFRIGAVDTRRLLTKVKSTKR
ncbi:MAG: hypothetical protein HY982_02140 [Candidatus Magasanikbacteria bacterium]|nr:hypothetical protein [Candidatus Magasanikbacteria bacterium]